MIDVSLFLVILIYFLLCLIYLMHFAGNTLNKKGNFVDILNRAKDMSISPRWVIRLSVIYHAMSLTVHITKMSDTSISDLSCYFSNCPYHQDEWYVYHSDLSCYVSNCPYHQDKWYVYHSDWSCYVSNCTVDEIKWTQVGKKI